MDSILRLVHRTVDLETSVGRTIAADSVWLKIDSRDKTKFTTSSNGLGSSTWCFLITGTASGGDEEENFNIGARGK